MTSKHKTAGHPDSVCLSVLIETKMMARVQVCLSVTVVDKATRRWGGHFSNVVIGDTMKQGQNRKYVHQVCARARVCLCVPPFAHAQRARGGERAVISCQPNCVVPPTCLTSYQLLWKQTEYPSSPSEEACLLYACTFTRMAH